MTIIKQQLLTPKELMFLSTILGHEFLTGIEDPLSGYFSEQIDKDWEKALLSLEAKSFILINDKSIIIDKEIAGTMKTLSEPDKLILIKAQKEKINTNIYFYTSKKLLIKKTELNDFISLETIKNKENLCKELENILFLKNTRLSKNLELSISIDDFKKIKKLIDTKKQSKALFIAQESLSKELAVMLLSCLDPKNTKLFIYVNDYKKNKESSFDIIKTEESLVELSESGDSKYKKVTLKITSDKDNLLLRLVSLI